MLENVKTITNCKNKIIIYRQHLTTWNVPSSLTSVNKNLKKKQQKTKTKKNEKHKHTERERRECEMQCPIKNDKSLFKVEET